MILLALVLQAAAAPPATAQPAVHAPSAAAPTAGATPQRFSILARQCGQRDDRGDIVVCANDTGGNRLPLPDEREPAPGRGANPELSGARALALQSTPCAARLGVCVVGFGPPLGPMVVAAAKALKTAFAKKPDKRGRIAIPLDDAAPAGVVTP